MANCPCCGAKVAEGDRVCSMCGTLVGQNTQNSRGVDPDDEQTIRIQPAQPQQFARSKPVQPPKPAQPPVWAQNVNPPQGVPVLQQPRSSKGAVTMIVFGAILLGLVLISLVYVLTVFISDYSSVTWSVILGASLELILFLGGGLMLLLFGIRKLTNVKRYNASLGNPQ